MTESLLRTRTHITLYLLGSVIMVLLAIQNVRYGFYDLFYTGLLFAPLFLIGAMYGWARRNDHNVQLGHLLILGSLMLLTGCVILGGNPNAHYWAYMLALFSYLLVPLRPAIYLSLATACWIGITLLAEGGLFQALRFVTSFALLMSLAALYAYLYHHKTRSLVDLAIKDALTGAYNLRHLEFTLKQEISRSESSRHPLSLIALDIDYYDQLLEVHGKNTVNELLSELSKLLRTMTRAGDSIYYSNDGLFYLLLPFTHQEGSVVIAERIRRTIEQHPWPVIDKMTASLGCSTRPMGQTDAQALLTGAHEALRAAQSSGHNRVSQNNRQRKQVSDHPN